MPRATIDSILARGPNLERDLNAQDEAWAGLVRQVFRRGGVPFSEQWAAYRRVFGARRDADRPPFVWRPDAATVERSNLEALRRIVGVASYEQLHRWSVVNRAKYWQYAIERLGIRFHTPPSVTLDTTGGVEQARWLPGGSWNAADACFGRDPQKTAIVFVREGGGVETWTYARLEALVNRVANGFQAAGFSPGDAVALCMPMTPECVAAYLGIVRAGGVVVSIADSFAPPELGTRLRISGARAVIVMESFERGGSRIDLYAKVVEAKARRAIVILGGRPAPALRHGDVAWDEFLAPEGEWASVPGPPQRVTNILFSSGTTGDPKAIPWTQLTPIKAAADGHFHQDIHAADVVAWPTNIGWMMGPWLIYATFYNGATMALYEGVPTSEGFTSFVGRAGVTVLGLVPAIVRRWIETGAADGGDWSRVRLFTSTGESSNVHDYLWLTSLTGYRAPVVEYCGGTEIGGGHLTGTVVQPASPATFSTPAMGLDFVVLDADGRPVPEGGLGEIFLVPPSVGLSQRLLNHDHHAVYYEGCPRGPAGEVLRRHGDEVRRLGAGYWQAHGRADDTMNLGGIKVSSVELERAMDAHPDVSETAAVAVAPPEGGAEVLVVFAVPARAGVMADTLLNELQQRLKADLNPLFRIRDVVLSPALPRTASNKVMRRELRARYAKDAAMADA